MEWWEKMVFPLQRFWTGVASRFRFRKNGLLLLHREVKACEYEDVRIMWEMLQKSDSELAVYPARSKSVWKIFSWARVAPCLVIKAETHETIQMPASYALISEHDSGFLCAIKRVNEGATYVSGCGYGLLACRLRRLEVLPSPFTIRICQSTTY